MVHVCGKHLRENTFSSGSTSCFFKRTLGCCIPCPFLDTPWQWLHTEPAQSSTEPNAAPAAMPQNAKSLCQNDSHGSNDPFVFFIFATTFYFSFRKKTCNLKNIFLKETIWQTTAFLTQFVKTQELNVTPFFRQ